MGKRSFGWQTKYGTFNVSASQADTIIASIKSQELFHKKMSLQEEFRAFL